MKQLPSDQIRNRPRTGSSGLGLVQSIQTKSYQYTPYSYSPSRSLGYPSSLVLENGRPEAVIDGRQAPYFGGHLSLCYSVQSTVSIYWELTTPWLVVYSVHGHCTSTIWYSGHRTVQHSTEQLSLLSCIAGCPCVQYPPHSYLLCVHGHHSSLVGK